MNDKGDNMTSRLKLASATALVMGTDLVQAQGGHMMTGGGWFGGSMGGNSGVWIPILLVVIVGLVLWVVMQKRK
jgi:hypothetical protein